MGFKDIYFNWMSVMVFPNIYERNHYNTLLKALHSSLFYFSIPMDENRMQDGIDLRYRFAYENGYPIDIVKNELYRSNTCSILEMMVALAIKGNERILYDYETGGRTDFIFKEMLKSLQIIDLSDENFSKSYFDYRISKFLNRDYSYNGNGGLFTVHDPRDDMRTVDIWYQMNWFLQKLYER